MTGESKILIASKENVRIYVSRCGHIDTNTGFIENSERGEAVLIDAPFGSFAAGEKIFSPGTKVIAVLFTHGHWDHIGDGHIFQKLGAKIYAHGLDKVLIQHPELMALFAPIDEKLIPCKIDADVADGDPININGWLDLACFWVPGHTMGGVTFYAEKFGCIFVGDTLFKGGIGRTDLPGGDENLLISGIGEKILTLPDDTTVIPGHGHFTTVGKEKIGNEFLAQNP
jgi:glyoxylase-like metal-dependent hydrolase (beta-lactamase superfamily II)